jgi:hypothetical protein
MISSTRAIGILNGVLPHGMVMATIRSKGRSARAYVRPLTTAKAERRSIQLSIRN